MPSRSGSRGRRPRPRPDAEVAAPPVLQVSSSGSGGEGSDEEEEEEEEEEEGSEGSGDGARGRGSSANEGKAAESEGKAEDPSLPSCPICMDGRVDRRWRASRECGKRYTQNNIINLYVPEIAVPSNYLEKQVLSMREKNESLERQQAKLLEEIKEYKRIIMLQQNIIYESSSKRQKMTEQSSDGMPGAELIASLTKNIDHSNLSSFALQKYSVEADNRP